MVNKCCKISNGPSKRPSGYYRVVTSISKSTVSSYDVKGLLSISNKLTGGRSSITEGNVKVNLGLVKTIKNNFPFTFTDTENQLLNISNSIKSDEVDAGDQS